MNNNSTYANAPLGLVVAGLALAMAHGGGGCPNRPRHT